MERCSNSVSSAISQLVKRATKMYILARIEEHQETWSGKVGEFRFDPEGYKDGKVPKQWDSFANYCDSENPETGRASPVTVTTGAAVAMTAMFVAVADTIKNEGRKIPAENPKTFLLNLKGDDAHILHFMVDVSQSEAVRGALATTNMSRDFNFKQTLVAKLKALVTDSSLIISGGEVIAELYLDLLKIIAWHAGNAVWRKKRFTLNDEELKTIFDTLGLHAQGGLDEDTVDFISLTVARHGGGGSAGGGKKKKPSPPKKAAAAAVPIPEKKEDGPPEKAPPPLVAAAAADDKPEEPEDSNGPADGPVTEGQTDSKADVLVDKPADAPTDKPADAPTDKPADIPANAAAAGPLAEARPERQPAAALRPDREKTSTAAGGQPMLYDDGVDQFI